MSTLPALDPALTAAILTGMAPRLLRRAEQLASEVQQWRITPGETTTIEIGTTTVTVETGGHPNCGCLLAPTCAHLAAVCLAAPTAGENHTSIAQPHEDTPEPTEDQPRPVSAATTERITAILTGVEPILTEITAHGLGGLSVAGHTRLLAAVQAARTSGLPRLERALTALATSSQALRLGQPVGRRALARQVHAVLLTRHLLARNPGDPQAVGTTRRVYRELDTESGPGAGSFTPLFAEPVISDSGFAGVSITLLSGRGELFQISRIPPGEVADAHRVWHSPVKLGDIRCSHADLSHRTLLITGGTSSEDGRLGSGRQTRAAQGQDITQDTLRRLNLPTELQLIDTTLTAVHGAGVETTGGHHFSFLPAARKLGVRSLSGALRTALSHGTVTLTLMLRNDHVMALWARGHQLDPTHRILPGLDQITPTRQPEPHPDSPAEENQPLSTPDNSVAQRLWPWLERCASQGAPSIQKRSAELAHDVTTLRKLAAPTGATLLDHLGHTPRQLDTLLSLGIYLTAMEHPS